MVTYVDGRDELGILYPSAGLSGVFKTDYCLGTGVEIVSIPYTYIFTSKISFLYLTFLVSNLDWAFLVNNFSLPS